MVSSLVPVPTFSWHTTLVSSQRHSDHISFHTSSNFQLPPCLFGVASASRSLPHITLCSSTSSVVVEEQNQQQDQEADEQEFTSVSQQPSSDDLPPGACKACGKTEIERGCNGEGRIQGGIATVPGFGWWPIKAYRPCPAFVASGGRYTRQGQSMDEVASGGSRYTRGSSVSMASDEDKSGKKRKDPKKFKR